MNGLHLHTCPDLERLATAFAATRTRVADPFRRPLLLVPGAGVQRWLGQQVARLSDAGGEGVMAGHEVHRVHALESLLSGERVDDPWRPERLVWAVLECAEAGVPGLEPLARHLDANDQRYANALRVARLVHRYADHRPAQLAAWLREPEASAAGMGFDGWQVRLWLALHDVVDAPDPLARRASLASAVAQGRADLPWPSVDVFAPRSTTPVQRGLLRALATRLRVDVWQVTGGPAESSNDLGARLGGRGLAWASGFASMADSVEALPDAGAVAPATALGLLQGAVLSGDPTPELPDDGTIAVVSSHGPARQVEVLREVLTGLFADDPTLEPRDAVILCPDPAALAPHLAATFAPPAGALADAWRHPGTSLRVQVADASASGANQVAALLGELLTLGPSRATATQLVALATHPFVSRRFGLGSDDLDRLEQLVESAAIRWGINREHRSWFDLADVAQNTWQLGVQRLVLGEAFSVDELTSVGHVATVDDVASTDAVRIGALAELVSRLSRLVRGFAEPTTAQSWAARLREAVELLADVPLEESWQLSQVWSVLASIEENGAASTASLGQADALALLAEVLADRGVRPAFGNGSLVVCSLDALPRVPHRVVCLTGLDDRSFPRRSVGDGDDLVLREPRPDDPDRGADDRQAVLDAVLAARERLVVVYQGQSTLTDEEHPAPVGVQELVEAIGADRVVRTPLHGFAPRNFVDAPLSFDAGALRGARALLRERTPERPRYPDTRLPRTTPLAALELDRVVDMLRNPAKFLLRERGDLVLGKDIAPVQSIPLQLTGLDVWKVGDAMVADLVSGMSLEAARNARWLSGEVPPRELGREVLEDVAARAHAVHARFAAVADGTPDAHLVDLTVDGVRVTGRVTTRGGLVAEAQFGAVGAPHLAQAWVRSLALTAALGRRTDAVVVGKGGAVHRLAAPPVDLAQGFLSTLVEVTREATERVLPMPAKVSQRWARASAREQDPTQDPWLEKDWAYERHDSWSEWFTGGARPWTPLVPPDAPWHDPARPAERELGVLAQRVWGPIVKATA